jgi:flavodoxin
MKANKWIVAMTAGVMAIGILSGCGNSDTPSDQNREPQGAAAVQEEKSTNASETGGNGGETEGALEETGTSIAIESESAKKDAPQGGKTLVVYYSASGHTEDVANVIADEMGADLFELEPVNPYTSDDLNYTNADSRVSREHENEEQRNVELVSVEVEDWDVYETVFIGYPIWWGIAAWPVDSFMETNDFAGKTVIPFCTSASSGFGESGELLEEKAGGGDWLEGIRFSSGVSEEDVRNWVSGLGLEQ